MKLFNLFGIFFIIAGAAIAIYGIVAFFTPSLPAAGPAFAAGVGVIMFGVVTLLAAYSHKVSFFPNETHV